MKHEMRIKYECPFCGRTDIRPLDNDKSYREQGCYFCCGNDDDYIVYMDPVSMIQRIESKISEDEPIHYIPSRIIFPSWSDSDDLRFGCDECNKCDTCHHREGEYGCDIEYNGLCPNSCDKCRSVTDDKLKFLEKNHFSYEEHWNLDSSVARFILPRLQSLRKNNSSYPCDLTSEDGEKQWDKILQSMVIYFKMKAKHGCPIGDNRGNKFLRLKQKVYDIGREAFAKYFDTLWD